MAVLAFVDRCPKECTARADTRNAATTRLGQAPHIGAIHRSTSTSVVLCITQAFVCVQTCCQLLLDRADTSI